MKTVLLNEIPRDEHLATEWNQLVFQMEAPEVCYTYYWAFAVSQAFPGTRTPFLILVYENSSLVGVGSLRLLDSERKACFLAEDTADYCDFVSRPADRARVLEAVFAKLVQSGISEFVAASILSVSATTQHLAAVAREYGFSFVEVGQNVSPVLELKGPSEREQTLQNLKRKKDISSQAKALAKIGQMEYSVANCWPMIDTELFWKAYLARTVVTKRNNCYSFESYRALVNSLVEVLAGKGWFALASLNLDGRVIAWGIEFRFLGKWLLYQCAFDPRLDQFGPGNVLLANVLNEAVNNPSVHAVDLGIGDERYKFRFTNTVRRVSRIVLTNDRLHYIKLRLRVEASGLLKRSKTCENIARKIVLLVKANQRARIKGIQS